VRNVLEFAYHRRPDAAEVRARIRDFFDRFFPESLRERRFDRAHDLTFLVRLRRWLAEEGYLDDALAQAVLYEESERVGFAWMNYGPSRLIAAVLTGAGNAEQRELAQRFETGDLVGSLGFTEPDSGSDISAARTRAVRSGDGWVINGQKMYTTLANHATHVLLLTRTDVTAPKHDGLTLFLVPLDTPGVEVRPLHTMVTHFTNFTYYTDVRVDDSTRIGEVDKGWQVMKVALPVEQGGMRNGHARWLIDAGARWFENSPDDRTPGSPAPDIARESLARAVVEQEVGTLLGYRNVWARHRGIPDRSARGPAAKMFHAESYIRAAGELLGLAGPEGLVSYEERDRSAGDGWLNYAFRDSPVRSIAGGASEVLRDHIAERRLGLPRQRPKAE
jgi:alkylation response protein AidB-like acyl-CoA dehydrogenase